jgi:hypothetical protein
MSLATVSIVTGACRGTVRDRLRAEGWREFRDFAQRPRVARAGAAAFGWLFDLTIDRCSGEVVDARATDGGRLGPFAYGPRGHWPPSF